MDDSKQPTSDTGLKDLSENHHEAAAREVASDPVAKKLARRITNVGYIVFGLLALALFFPMLFAIGQGIQQQRAWDPYSNEPALSEEAVNRCIDDAQRLMLMAATETSLRPAWDDPQSEWNRRCQDQHPDLYDMLNRTRSMLHKRGSK